ncbi:MAG: hypothetical protein ACREJB_17035 [Planctomycetaceae bacterium]
MNEAYGKGISCEGLDAESEAMEIRKSNLILQARLLADQRDWDGARNRFAEAAAIERELADRCRNIGLNEKAFIHHWSAAGCWAQAGNLYDALRTCDEILERSDVPERLRRVEDFAAKYRVALAQWHESKPSVAVAED